MRDVSIMFESFALYPMMTVADNIAFAMRAPTREGRDDEAEIARRLEDVLALTEMSELRGRLPHELSGGQKQRVALCRALALEPMVYMLDEPISHLDAKLRHKLRAALRQRLVASATPTLWFTPDSMEALSVADRVAVIIDGRLQQFDHPEAIYDRPANTRVARLVGDPPMNLLRGSLVRDNGTLLFRNEAVSLALPEAARLRVEANNSMGEMVLGIRATDMEIVNDDRDGTCDVEVYSYEPFGKYAIVSAGLGNDTIKAKFFHAHPVDVGDVLSIRLHGANAVVFDGATENAI
jgi:ABC-type sugar transport system ATPase subunit